MKKITLIANLLLILFLFIVPQFIGKSPKTSIEQRIVVELSYLTNDLMTDELNNLKSEIINNTKMSDKKIIELTQNLKTSLNSTLNNIYIYQSLRKFKNASLFLRQSVIKVDTFCQLIGRFIETSMLSSQLRILSSSPKVLSKELILVF